MPPKAKAANKPKAVIKSSELKAEFERLSGGDGSIDFGEISALEEKFKLSMKIATDMQYWKDSKVTYLEFVDMLERNGNIKVQIRRSELDEAFKDASGGDGAIDFGEVEKIEQKYKLPMGISSDMKYWQDMKITKDEFIEMLTRNGNIMEEEENVKDSVKALFRKYVVGSDDMLSVDLMQKIVTGLSPEWTEARLETLCGSMAKDGRINISEFFDWCFA